MNKFRQAADGQVLPLFALFIVVLLLMAALAIDVSSALSARRFYRSVADAAALAGAQDLQQGTTRAVGTLERTNARTHALQQLASLLGGSTSACDPTSAPTVSCSVNNFDVSVTTPSPTCVDCDPSRAVEVTVRNPNFGLSFARLAGFDTWSVASTSVAGLTFGKSYTIVTLRPPQPNGSSGTYDVRDLRLDGGTRVIVTNGDVGTNSNMEYGGTNSLLDLTDGYSMYYFDPYNGPEWSTPADPPGQKLTAMIPDPGYVIPPKPTAAGAQDLDEAVGSRCQAIAASLLADMGYGPYIPAVAGLPDMSSIDCYLPGLYPDVHAGNSISVGNGDLAILEPGLYWFEGDLDAQGSVIGGYTPSSPGVALVFEEGTTKFKNRTSGGSTAPSAIALNAGSRFGSSGGAEADAARDQAGNPIVTNTIPAIKMTLIVTRDGSCPVVDPYPAGCDTTNKNFTVDLAGNSTLYLAGVQFMPTDNATINSSGAFGYVGQIWAWTLHYSGGTFLNQEGSQGSGTGVLRLDAACTTPSTPCN